MRETVSIKQRITALVLAILLVFAEIPGLSVVVRADYLAPQLTVTLYSGDAMPNGEPESNTAMLFKTYLSEIRNPNDEITLAMNALLPFAVEDDAIQLGTATRPFAGKIHFNAISEASFTCAKALFAYISTDAKFLIGAGDTPFTDPISFTRVPTEIPANLNSALFADHVVKGTADSIAWNIHLLTDGENTLSYAGVLGEIGAGAGVELTLVNDAVSADSVSNVYSQGNVGLLCGVMQQNSTLTATLSGTNTEFTITSDSGAAGGLVGVMYQGSTLVLNTSYDDHGTVTVTASGNAYSEPEADPDVDLLNTPAATAPFAPAASAEPAPAQETPAPAVEPAPAQETPAPAVEPAPAQETPAPAVEPTEEPAPATEPTEEPAPAEPQTAEPPAETPAESPESTPAEAAPAEPAPVAETAGPSLLSEFVVGSAPVKETAEQAPAETPAVEPAPATEPTEESAPAKETPAPAEEPTEEPAPATEPTKEPAPAEEPTEEPAPATEPTKEPAPAEEPTEEPAPTTEPTAPAEEAETESAPTQGQTAAEAAVAAQSPVGVDASAKAEKPEEEEEETVVLMGTAPAIDAATLKRGYAGGIVGWAEDATIELEDGISVTVSGRVIGSVAAGGVYGHYRATEDRTFELDDYEITATIGLNSYTSARLGGVFGMLFSTADVTVTDATFQPSAGTLGTFNLFPAFVHGDACGGLIGYYDADTLGRVLLIRDLKTRVTTPGSATIRGGVIGRISDHPAYVEFRNVGVYATVMGGLVGSMGNGGSFVNVCEYVGLQGSADGGLVAYMNQGVLRLQGITHMHDTANFSGGMETSRGQLVRQRGNGLVYAVGTGSDASVNNSAGTGWIFRRAGATRRDDIFDWGEVLRLTSGVITEDLSAHTVTVSSAVTSMGTATDFAKTALNVQLNVPSVPAGGALRFAAGDDSATLLSSTLSLSSDISLSGTGLTGLTRDDNSGGAFSGTFNGNNHTITLATGEIYGQERTGSAAAESSVNRGAGRIYNHCYNGLIGKANGATVNDLTVDGIISVAQVGSDSYSWYNGGIVANSTGNLTLSNCNVRETITDTDANDKGRIYVGGAVGFLVDAAGTVTIDGGTYAADIVDQKTSANTSFYASGVIGYVNSADAASSSGQINIAVSDVTIGGSFDNTAATEKNYAHFGGLIGYIRPNNSNVVKRTVTIQDVTIGDLSITEDTNEAAGGLLGYQWLGADVTIGTSGNTDGLTIGDENDDSASPTVSFSHASGTPMVGGLVFGATGHWVIHHVDAQNVTYNTTSANADFGFVAARGVIPGPFDAASALYLEIAGDMPADYDLSGVKVTGSGFRLFDEIVCYTVPVATSGTSAISVSPSPITNNGAAVVSMHTLDNGGVVMDGSACNTYQNQTDYGVDHGCVNPNSRYYYNLDLIRAKGTPSDAEKLLIWSLHRYSRSTINSYFTDYFGSTVTGSFDMAGVTYYPITASGLKIKNATVKFYNEGFEQSENLVGGDDVVRSSRAATQHDLFHSGILYDSNNLSVSNLTLQGTVGAKGDGSGFLVRGTLHDAIGKYSDVTNVTLDGAMVRSGAATPAGVPGGYAPLLINKVGSSVTTEPTNLTVSQVKTTGTYAAAATAGSSLIGSVEGLGIQLTFSDMRLDARTGALADATANAALTDAYGTTKSIFTRATILNNFTHTDAASNGRYNYNLAEDWSGATPVHHVTYGKEINGAVEYSGITQNEYFDQVVKTNPTSNGGGAYNFNDGSWRPYVYTGYNAEDHTHELRINQKMASFDEGGCGKYDDPYLITDGSQLVSVAQIIRGEAVDSSFHLVLPDSLTPNTPHTASGAGSQANDKSFSYNSATGNFTSGGSSYTFNAVREYLAGAYYSIAQDITIPDTGFTGLGAVTTDFTNYVCPYAFRGVIEGNTRTIHNESAAPLIANSNGAVVRNLRLSAEKGVTLTQANASNNTSLVFSYNGGMQSYGAVIGKVMGGDTFLDNVSVEFNLNGGSIAASGTAARLIPIGGYIGVIVNGGVIFRNMPENAGSGTADVCAHVDDSGYLYANPVIGRVLMGYAFSEGADCVIDNGTKNYAVPRLDPSVVSKLSLSDGTTVTVPNGQAMWVLGAALNSGGAAASDATAAFSTIVNNSQIWSAYRNYTAARLGGTNAETGAYEYNDSNYGATSNGKTPYILTKYSTGNTRTIGSLTDVTLDITGACDVPVGFRGIGCLYKEDNNLRLTTSTIDGNGNTVTLHMSHQEYDVTNSGENYKATSTSSGFGMINSLRQNTSISDLTISGNVFYDVRRAGNGNTLKYASRTGNECDAADIVSGGTILSTGGVVGLISAGTVTVTNVTVSNLTLEGASYAGGIIGKTTKPLSLNTSGGSNITIRGGLQAGGLVGAINSDNTSNVYSINGGSGTTLSDVDIYTKGYRGDGTESGANVAAAAGIIGVFVNGRLTLQNYTVNGGKISTFYYTGQNQTSLAAGAVGLIRSCAANSVISDFTLEDVNIEGPMAGGCVGENVLGSAIKMMGVTVRDTNSANGHSYIRGQRLAGGLMGCQQLLANCDTCSVSGYDIYILPGASLWDRNSAGGLIGFTFKDGCDLRNIRIDDCEIFTNNASNNNGKNSAHGGAGGLIGRITAGAITGNNILINDTEISNYATVTITGDTATKSSPKSTNFGSITGWKANSDSIKLVGVSIVDSSCYNDSYDLDPIGTITSFANYGYGTGGYVVYADYNGATTGIHQNTQNAMLYGGSDLPAEEPYVTVNPAATIDVGGHILTGDGVASTATDMPIRAILDDAGDRYELSWGKSGIRTDLASRLSTFKNECAITDSSPDVGVFVIEASTAATEITQILNSYLDLLTDTTFNYSDPDQISNICTVTFSRMALENGNFTNTSSDVSMRWDQVNRRFAVNGGLVDNNRDSFTLLDVAYCDPAHRSDVAYHLYVPILVKKVLEFEFSSYVLTGTTYREADYADKKQVLENFGTPVTLCFNYTYNRTASEWIHALENGDSLMDNYAKSILLSKYENVSALPLDAQLALVDAQTGKAYYRAAGSINGELNLSTFVAEDGTTPFEPASLSKLLGLTAASSETGVFVRCAANDADALAQDGDGNTYKLYTDEEGVRYDLSATTAPISETYYLSIFTKTADTGIARYTVDCAKRLPDAYPTLCISSDSVKRSDMILGKVYTIQSTLTTSGGDVDHVMDQANDTISARMTTRIILNDGAIYRDYVGSIYHSFLLHLNKTDEEGSRTSIVGNPIASGTYSVDGGATQSYMSGAETSWTAAGGFAQFTVAENLRSHLADPARGYATNITANVTLDYNSNKAAMEEQFPVRPADILSDTTTGTTVFLKSNIASTAERTAYSHTSERTDDSSAFRYFSGVELKEAVLYYNTLHNSNVGDLGINPLDEDTDTSVMVQTRGVLNFRDVARQSEGYTHLRITLQLGQKSDGYLSNLNFSNYFDSLTVAGNNCSLNTTAVTLLVPKENATLVFSADGYEVTVPVDYVVKTGSAFEAGGARTYSNYKVTLDVDLVQVVGNAETVLVDSKSNYIIYTNARVIPEFLES